MSELFPEMQKLFEELAQHGGYAVISLMTEQIRELQKAAANSIGREELAKVVAQSKVMQNEVKMTISEMTFLRTTVDTLKDDLFKLARGPSEEEFGLLRGRVDGAEKAIA